MDFFNHLNEGGGLQPSQPFLWSGYGDFQRKKKEKKPWCFYFAAKYLSNGKNGLTNPPLKYPASRKVLFGTERLSGRTWARLLLGNGKLIRFWDDVWPCHSPQRCMP